MVSYLFTAFFVLLLLRAVLSWIPSLNGGWSTIVFRLTDPIINPVNRLIPPIGGFSLAFIAVIYVTQFLMMYFHNQAISCQYRLIG